MRLSLQASVIVALLCLPLLAQQPPHLTQKSGGPGKPLSPTDAQKLFQVAKGLRIELVAAEPLVQSPVAIAWDESGRLFVVEMQDYPNGPPKSQPPEGRIRILHDKNGDGKFDEATTFADKLLFANGLLPWKNGLIVTAAPHIVYLEDKNGDGEADTREVLFEGFAAQNPQLRVSHPVLGLDGWVYCANGLRGGKVVSKRKKDAVPVSLNGMDFRFNPNTDEYEAVSGPGQFGNCFDDWGNRFVCDNRHHLRHIVMENRYLKRNPFVAASALVEDVSLLEDGPLSSGGKIYPLSKNWTTSSLHEGRFTAACGVHIYGGKLLPKEYQGAAFTCDPTGNLVHVEAMTPRGATFEAKPLFDAKEFLASPNDWFRPVFLATGPEGALYVVDMCRAVIEHPEFMPPELRNRPDLTLGKEMGRIWRIVPEEGADKIPMPASPIQIKQKKPKDLVKLLEHPEVWWRSTAARLLWQSKTLPNDELRRLMLLSKEPRTRIQAAHLLGSWTVDEGSALWDMLADKDSRAREHALRLAERNQKLSEPGLKRLLAMADDPDARVRFQLALLLGEWTDKRRVDALARIACLGADDKWTRLAVVSTVADAAGELFAELLEAKEFAKLAEARQKELIYDCAALVGARQDPQEIENVLEDMRHSTNTSYTLKLAGLSGLGDGLSRRGASLAAMLSKLPNADKQEAKKLQDWIAHSFDESRKVAAHVKADAALRLQAIRFLAAAPLKDTEKLLVELMNSDPQQEVRLAATRSLSAYQDRQIPALLLKSWRSYSPAVRREVTEALFRNLLRINALLDEIEAKRVRPGDLDAQRTRQLLGHGNATIRERAQKLLSDNLPADRKAVLAKYELALAVPGDGKRGLDVFKKNCATCHRVAGVGLDVGPDIADTRTKTLDALLTDILNPNAAIDNNYVNYLVSTKSGRSMTGLLAAENASSVTLKRAEGQTDVILRQDIEEIQSTGVSLMPEALEKTISVQEMADLLQFLKNWRYLDGSVPVGR
ncbi:MAG: HEAT repeat domain-containing protein [Gemmataceae bacterium]|nr:HEAT repeat domain-containing protein [Gemmataceae bacterium]MCI0743039.1 HEAT repeat domain-containing protein [Gemmataceae bacterium]